MEVFMKKFIIAIAFAIGLFAVDAAAMQQSPQQQSTEDRIIQAIAIPIAYGAYAVVEAPAFVWNCWNTTWDYVPFLQDGWVKSTAKFLVGLYIAGKIAPDINWLNYYNSAK